MFDLQERGMKLPATLKARLAIQAALAGCNVRRIFLMVPFDIIRDIATHPAWAEKAAILRDPVVELAKEIIRARRVEPDLIKALLLMDAEAGILQQAFDEARFDQLPELLLVLAGQSRFDEAIRCGSRYLSGESLQHVLEYVYSHLDSDIKANRWSEAVAKETAVVFQGPPAIAGSGVSRRPFFTNPDGYL